MPEAKKEPLAYWRNLPNVITSQDINDTTVESVELVIGLFSGNDPKTAKNLDHGTSLIHSREDLAKTMRETWHTNANVELKYQEIKKIFSTLQDQISVKLQFQDPKDFSRKNLCNKICDGENSFPSEQQGLTKLLVLIKILDKLIDFTKIYSNEFSSFIRTKQYTNLFALIKDMIEQPWGQNFLTILERDNMIENILNLGK